MTWVGGPGPRGARGIRAGRTRRPTGRRARDGRGPSRPCCRRGLGGDPGQGQRCLEGNGDRNPEPQAVGRFGRRVAPKMDQLSRSPSIRQVPEFPPGDSNVVDGARSFTLGRPVNLQLAATREWGGRLGPPEWSRSMPGLRSRHRMLSESAKQRHGWGQSRSSSETSYWATPTISRGCSSGFEILFRPVPEPAPCHPAPSSVGTSPPASHPAR